tara:strand:+ start:502 stop:708 length:207 start_codon:yes stop_codon:yes gene_type:complete
MSLFTQHERMVLSKDPAILDLWLRHDHGGTCVVFVVEEQGTDDRAFMLTVEEVAALRDKLSELLEYYE